LADDSRRDEHHARTLPGGEDGCRLSVIVPAYNAAGYLEECLSALSTQTLQPERYEVIVVDDLSTDETVEVASAFGARVIRARENAGPAHARNLGAWAASGEILFFADADVVVRPDVLERALTSLDSEPAIAAVFGSYDDAPRAKGTLSEYRNLLHHFVHQNGSREAATFWTGCGAVRRSVFLQLGGLDVAGHPRCVEDIEFGYRLRSEGFRILLDRRMLCTHPKRWTLRSWLATDIFGRALPWAKLMLTRRQSPNDLNIRGSQKLSVALTGLGLFGAALAGLTPWFLAAGAALIATAVLINLRLFGFFLRQRGFRFALVSIPLHLTYFVYSGLSFVAVWLSLLLGMNVRDGNSPPVPPRSGFGWQRATLTAGAGAWWTISAANRIRRSPGGYGVEEPGTR
jgi:GT2 family glycosyltransferase